MNYSTKISKIKKSKIDNLIISINIVKPKCIINKNQLADRWKNVNKNQREDYILSFIVSNSFTENELSKIYKLTTKLIIPWKNILYTLIIIFLTFISVKGYIYSKLDRIYYIGISNKLTTTNNFDLTVNPLLEKENIFYGSLITSQKSFIKLKILDDSCLIQEDNFFKWIFGNVKNLKVDTTDFVQSKLVFEKYISIFKPLIYLDDFNILSSNDRKAIYNYIQINPNILSISNDINNNKINLQDSSYSILARTQYNSTYIYIRFNDIDNKNKNYLLQYSNIQFPNAIPLITKGSTISYDNFLFFKKE